MTSAEILTVGPQLSLGQRAASTEDQSNSPGVPLQEDYQRDLLLLRHLPQVRFIARRIHGRLPPQVLLDDLVHAGILGLMDAVKKYDPAKKVQLKHYAEFRIRGAILDSLRQVDWSPRTLRNQARRLNKAVIDCQAQLGREPTEPEIAIALNMTLLGLQHLRGDLRGLDLRDLQDPALLSGDGNVVVSHGGQNPDPYYQALRSEMRELLSTELNQLSLREQEVLGLYDYDELTMKEVAKTMGIGESRVSQIHSSAMLHLRARLFKRLRRIACSIEVATSPASVEGNNPRKTLLRCSKTIDPLIRKLNG